MTQIENISDLYSLVKGRHGLFLANRNDVYIGRSLLEYGEYGWAEWQMLSQICKPGSVVIEVGANAGTLTIPLARTVDPEGHVIAIEPQPVIHQNLCANIALNSLTNVTTHQCACGSEAGQVMLPAIDYTNPGNFGGVALQEEREGTFVDIKTLDSLCPHNGIRLIKIDVEGMEEDVLTGARDIIQQSRPVLYLENDRLEKSQSLIEAIWGLDYEAWWHIPPLYSNDNFFANEKNVFGNCASFNMLCLPKGQTTEVRSLDKVIDSAAHPLRQR